MYKNTIFRAYAYQPVGNRESWERKPTKHFGNQNYDAEKSEKILRSKVELKSLQHYNSSPLCAIAFSGLVLSLSPTGGRSWVRKKNSLLCGFKLWIGVRDEVSRHKRDLLVTMKGYEGQSFQAV